MPFSTGHNLCKSLTKGGIYAIMPPTRPFGDQEKTFSGLNPGERGLRNRFGAVVAGIAA